MQTTMYSYEQGRVKPSFSIPKISKRESEVLHLIALEYTIKEIAEELFISPHTAISHRRNLMTRWEVKNAPGLVRKGFELGVLSLRV